MKVLKLAGAHHKGYCVEVVFPSDQRYTRCEICGLCRFYKDGYKGQRNERSESSKKMEKLA